MIILVGEQNPYTTDEAGAREYALFPHPRGATGDRLRQLAGLTDVEYLFRFERANLLHKADRWSAPLARVRARQLVDGVGGSGDFAIVALGRRVCDAFSQALLHKRLEAFDSVHAEGKPALFHLPHPSGANRIWNEPEAVAQARDLLRNLLTSRYAPTRRPT